MNSPNSTFEAIGKIMRRAVPGVPRIMMPSVDVRDVALAHILALEKPGINGLRFVIN